VNAGVYVEQTTGGGLRASTRAGGALAAARAMRFRWAAMLLAQLWHAVVSVGAEEARSYGLESRPPVRAFLSMPDKADGVMPERLSQTGAFQDTAGLRAAPGLIPYDLLVPFWSDGASKTRWMALPNVDASSAARIKFAPTGEWVFPPGTVFVKHFDLATNEARPDLKRRLETRLLVCDSTGAVYGVTYKWHSDNSDADLLTNGLTERILIQTANGFRTQAWYYPSRQDCKTCHTRLAGGVLGPKTRQLNRTFAYSSGVTDNELRTWNHLGLFEPGLDETKIPEYPALSRANDMTRSLEERSRSYLDSNCAHCHRPGGTILDFDTRYDTPLSKQGLIDGAVLIDEGLDNARMVAPKDTWRSVLFLRVNTLEGMKMPPLAHQELDCESVALLREWILSLPGKPVLPPPAISPKGGRYSAGVEVAVSGAEPGATIHYTLDGSVPDKTDAAYEKPIRLAGPTVLRAKAFKPGYTKSITVQEVFVIGD
jgi:uncharacterized repeat protein (TIGR03806 family)